MKMVITPTYSDIFNEEIPNLESLIEGIPSKFIISLLSMFNAELYLSEGEKSQFRIFNFITQRIDNSQRKKILDSVKAIRLKNQNYSVEFFTVLANQEFIHHELLNFRDLKIVDTTPEQEFNFIKAYFVIVERINNNYKKSFFEDNEDVKGEFFQTYTWPTFIEQFEVNHNKEPFVSLFRGLALLNYFNSNEDLKKYVSNFIKSNKQEHYWHYLKIILNFVQMGWKERDVNGFKPFVISESEETKKILDNFSLNVRDYNTKYKKGKKNYSGLKESPLFKSLDERYTVLNWNYITNKLYEGLIFDFYKLSGINEVKQFSKFVDYKNFISEEITEKFLFKKILSKYLNQKHSKLIFDDSNIEGFPDAYYRNGKHIFLFEIKDAYFPVDAINSYSYKEICDAIDLKYNSTSKGTGQIIKQLKRLVTSPFEEKSYDELKLKTRNLIIYPIIIYTDNFFSLPGINRYLNQGFKEKLENEHLEKHFEQIKKLSFINISFLLNHIHKINNFNLKNIIDEYQRKLNSSEEKFKKSRIDKDMFSMNDNFETFISKSKNINKETKDDYIEKIFDILEIEKSIP